MMTMTRLGALFLGVSLAGSALAQDAVQTPPAEAGAGTAAEDATETAEAGAEAGGDLVLPNGQDMTPVEMMDGRWMNDEGIPTFNVEADGTVDFATFNGFRRYHAECHVCHGPDGEGSTYAPALKNSVLRMDYYDFMQVVASGRQSSNSVMPAFGTNKNVWCYIDDIYTYLVAHGTGTIPRGRPAERADKPDEFAELEDACMSS